MNSHCRYRFLNNQTTSIRRPEDVGVRGTQTNCPDRSRLKRRVSLYGRQHSKETFQTFPSCAMNHIATDVAAAIK